MRNLTPNQKTNLLIEQMAGDLYTSSRFYLMCILILLFASTCAPAYYLKHQPNLTSSYFRYKVDHLEKLIEKNPNDLELLITATKLNTQYAYGFLLEKADRLKSESYQTAISLYDESITYFTRAEKYGIHALSIRHPDFPKWIKTKSTQHILQTEDVPIVYWTAAAIGGKISAGRANPADLIQLPDIGWLLEHAIEISPGWNYGALSSAMFSYLMSRPDKNATTEKHALSYYEKAIIASNGLDCSLYVTYAEKISVLTQNRSEFISLLNKVLSLQANDNPELYFSNIIAQSRAEWLLTQTDELFY